MPPCRWSLISWIRRCNAWALYLSDAREADDEKSHANAGHEQRLPFAEEVWPFVDDSRNESFKVSKLWTLISLIDPLNELETILLPANPSRGSETSGRTNKPTKGTVEAEEWPMDTPETRGPDLSFDSFVKFISFADKRRRLTGSGHFTDRFVLLPGHETDDGENGESREETGAGIDGAYDERLPARRIVKKCRK